MTPQEADRRILRALLLIVAGSLALWLIAWLISQGMGGLRVLDERWLVALRVPGDLDDPIGPRALETAMRDLTALGGTTVLTLVTLAVMARIGLRGDRRGALLLGLGVLGGLALSNGTKWLVGRPRPHLVPQITETYAASFPSGHSMMAAACWLLLAALLARTEAVAAVRRLIFALATGVILLVGVSRVYLGVHWPTDVLAGWTMGSAWATLCAWAATRLDPLPRVASASVSDRAA